MIRKIYERLTRPKYKYHYDHLTNEQIREIIDYESDDSGNGLTFTMIFTVFNMIAMVSLKPEVLEQLSSEMQEVVAKVGEGTFKIGLIAVYLMVIGIQWLIGLIPCKRMDDLIESTMEEIKYD